MTQFSPNHGPRFEGQEINMLIFHYTGMDSAESALERLCDPKAEVSAHFLVEENGVIHQLVPEERRAWHAGAAFWAGESDINGCSIGIEIVNKGHALGYCAFPLMQMKAVEVLCRSLLSRFPIPPERVLGHSDVAPQRKEDPGEYFDWQALACEAIGLWPQKKHHGLAPRFPSDSDCKAALAEIGYAIVEDEKLQSPHNRKVIVAFQRRFLPQVFEQDMEGELTDATIEQIWAVKGCFEEARQKGKKIKSNP